MSLFGALFGGTGAITEINNFVAGPARWNRTGTAVTGTGAITVAWPEHQTGDIALLFLENQDASAPTLSTPSGFAAVADSPQYNSQGGSSTRLTVYWCRATSNAMADVVVADPGDHVIGQIVTFRGCVETGNPWDVTAGDVNGSASASVSVPGDTTTEDNCLIVVAATCHNSGGTTAFFSGWANSDLIEIIEVCDSRSNSGGGGGFAAATGIKQTAGAYGATTATAASSAFQGRMSIALKSAQAASVSDGTPPVITGFTPAVGTDIRSQTVLQFDVTDETSLALVAILASFPDGSCETVHDGDAFRGNYRNGNNTRTAITDGYRFTVRRDDGWKQAPTLEWLALDGSGNRGVIS